MPFYKCVRLSARLSLLLKLTRISVILRVMNAFVSTFLTVFREGLESFLVAGISIAYLRRSGRAALLPAAYASIALAVVASGLIGWWLFELGELGAGFEGALALTAAILIITCTVQLLRAGPKMKQRITDALSRSAEKPSLFAALGIGAFLFLMITREGLEAGTMIAALSSFADSRTLVYGALAGLIAAGALAAWWSVAGRKIPLSLFFQFAAIFLLIFSLQLVIYAVHEFSEAGLLPLVDNDVWHELTEPYGPEGEIGAWLTYALAIVPSTWLIFWWLRENLDFSRRTQAN